MRRRAHCPRTIVRTPGCPTKSASPSRPCTTGRRGGGGSRSEGDARAYLAVSGCRRWSSPASFFRLLRGGFCFVGRLSRGLGGALLLRDALVLTASTVAARGLSPARRRLACLRRDITVRAG